MTKEELKLTSKEALERLEMVLNWNGDIDIDKDLYDLWVNLVCRTIEKDLDRLEKLEKENQELKGKVNYLKKFIEKYEKEFIDHAKEELINKLIDRWGMSENGDK